MYHHPGSFSIVMFFFHEKLTRIYISREIKQDLYIGKQRKDHLDETMILGPLNLDVEQPELFLTNVGLCCWKGLTRVRVDEVLQQLHISEERKIITDLSSK